jgi:hypothetical protein
VLRLDDVEEMAVRVAVPDLEILRLLPGGDEVGGEVGRRVAVDVAEE